MIVLLPQPNWFPRWLHIMRFRQGRAPDYWDAAPVLSHVPQNPPWPSRGKALHNFVGLSIDHFHQVAVIFRREEEILRAVQDHFVGITFCLNPVDHTWNITETDNHNLAIT